MSRGGAIFVSDAVEARWASEIEAAAPDRPRVVSRPDGPPPDFDAIEVLFFSGDLYPERTREAAIAALKASRLRWVHSFSAGVDNPFFQTLLARGVRLTTSAGAHATPIAHSVLLYLLALSRDLPGWLADQRAHRWSPREFADLQGRHLGIVGLGAIGREVARLAEAFGLRVSALRREPRGDEPCETRPLSQLADWLPELDVLVLSLALTPETRGLIDAAALARLKPGSLLVNVARGEIVDEAVLVEALRSGQLGGAALDVFEQEPLPASSPLWDMPRVIVTPHSSGATPGNLERSVRIFLDNLERYEAGHALRNEVPAPTQTR